MDYLNHTQIYNYQKSLNFLFKDNFNEEISSYQKEDLQLCHCDEILLPEFDINYHFEDVMWDSTDDIRNYLDADVISAAKDLSEAIKKMKPFFYIQSSRAVLWQNK